jgi:aromatic ring-opening dioxygenase catalytic subunit (LigB family)
MSFAFDDGSKAAGGFPSVFVSHGAPTLAVEENGTVEFLKRLGEELGRPEAILCVSAHWDTEAPAVSGAERPETIHDFGGFPDELYRMQEHLLPLFVALGAGSGESAARGRGLHRGWTWGSLSMAAYGFGAGV